MIQRNSIHLKKLNNCINSIDKNAKNNFESIYLNQIHNEFITFPANLVIPKISVKELDHENTLPIVQNLGKVLPELLINHSIPLTKYPASDQHVIHFIQRITGSLLNFLHILKIDCKFSGDPKNILEKGDSIHYPSFKTNRIYYKSFIIPVSDVDDQFNFNAIRIIQSQQVDSDQYFHTYALFDDINKQDTIQRFHEFIGNDLFSISPTLYPFFQFEYFTACLSVLYPIQREIIDSIAFYEPIFIFLYSKYNSIDTLHLEDNTIMHAFGELLTLENNTFLLTDTLKESIRTYCNRYSLFRDDELALKGWWQFQKKQ